VNVMAPLLLLLLKFHVTDAIKPSPREVNVTLVLGVLEYHSAGVTFLTRAYNGTIPGPPIYVNPGDTLRVTLVNELEHTETHSTAGGDASKVTWCGPSNCTTPDPEALFSIPNRTNLHTHGFHTSPVAPGDDVLNTAILPGRNHTYIYEIPTDHMAGTFWYHPHLDGSVALQTAGGAAGLLVINDYEGNGVSEEVRKMDEQVMFLQTVPQSALIGISAYSGDLLTKILSKRPVPSRTTDNNQYSDLDGSFNASLIDNVGIVNGKFQPKMEVKSGRWARWRLVHAGPAFFMDLTLEAEEGLAETTHDRAYCEMQLLAKDGIYLAEAPRSHQRVVLPPGGRADVAVRCHGKGTLRLSSGERPGASGVWNGDMYWNPRLATIKVRDDDTARDERNRSVRSHHHGLEVFRAQRPRYLSDLQGATVDGRFSLSFADAKVVMPGTSIDLPVSGLLQDAFPYNGDTSGTCTFNGMTFNRSQPLGRLSEEGVQEWEVAGVQGHPLHIHVNPHQVLAFSAMNTATGCDIEYGYICQGDFHDTLQIPQPDGIANATIRFRTADFSGPQVLHCHYLIHEDLGCISFHNISNGM